MHGSCARWERSCSKGTQRTVNPRSPNKFGHGTPSSPRLVSELHPTASAAEMVPTFLTSRFPHALPSLQQHVFQGPGQAQDLLTGGSDGWKR